LPGTPDVDYDCSPKLDSNVYYDKFDLKNVPDDFLQKNHVVTLLHDIVLKLEQSYRIQTDIDSAYMDICTIIKDEMYEKISHKKCMYNLVEKYVNPGGVSVCPSYGIPSVRQKENG